jgi:hypothetical protein
MERCGLGRERDQASLDRQKCVVKCAAGQQCNALIQIAFRRCVDRPASAIERISGSTGVPNYPVCLIRHDQ